MITIQPSNKCGVSLPTKNHLVATVHHKVPFTAIINKSYPLIVLQSIHRYDSFNSLASALISVNAPLRAKLTTCKGWFPLGVDCGRGVENSLFLYLVAPSIKLNRETKNFSRHPCNLRLMETSLK